MWNLDPYFVHGMNPQRNKKKWTGFFLSFWTWLRTSMFLVMYQALPLPWWCSGEERGHGRVLLSRALVSLASQFVKCLSHAPPLPNLWLMVHMFSAVFFTQRDSSLHTVNSSSVHLQQSFLSNCFFALASSQVPKNASVSAGLLSGPGSKWDCNYLHDLWSKSYRNLATALAAFFFLN